jgi:hypothetical protein
MSIRLAARIMEEASLELSRRGRGYFGHRERHAHQAIGEFVGVAFSVGPGGALPREIRDDLQARIDRTIDALETYVGRDGSQSAARAAHDTGLVREIYVLREAQQHLMQTRHELGCWATPIVTARRH